MSLTDINKNEGMSKLSPETLTVLAHGKFFKLY